MEEVIVFVDIETGGLELTRPIIQIAAIAIDADFQERETIELKIAFDRTKADPASLPYGKYNPHVWRREALSPRYAARKFAAFLRRHATFSMISREGRSYRLAQLAGHNAERFDSPFIHAWYRRQQVFCPARYMTLCTKQKALWLFEEDKSLTPPADFKLGTLCQYFDVWLRKEDAHDALVDVRATVKLYQAMCEHQRRQFAVAA
jgi:DNA polymerase III epsilon subunit-like protein